MCGLLVVADVFLSSGDEGMDTLIGLLSSRIGGLPKGGGALSGATGGGFSGAGGAGARLLVRDGRRLGPSSPLSGADLEVFGTMEAYSALSGDGLCSSGTSAMTGGDLRFLGGGGARRVALIEPERLIFSSVRARDGKEFAFERNFGES